MSVEQIEASIRALPPEEREQLANWFDEHRHELIADCGEDPSLEQRSELLRRKEAFLADPSSAEPWEGTAKKIHQHLHARRAQKTAAGRR